MGASGIVYETNQKYAAKFFTDASSNLKSKEKHIIDTLNSNKPTGSDVLLQQVVDSDDEIYWPALLLKPVGAALTLRSCYTFKREDSFFSVLETLKHAHSYGIIHNDIRPENIVIVEGNKWLLIDWAASWELKLLDEVVKREYYGCVTYASDLVLTQLAECRELVRDDNNLFPIYIE
jgi:serine/threonine protein kinase